ncbi:MAG: ATP-dependent RNA helicase [Candidatus Eremiobacteraeota bacterium]|nr:ATP-dependent RNA helicase [Candidatus Eremiobacteraeota bacterium]
MEFPVDGLEATFRQALKEGDVVLSAPTGSGKSTRVPTWCPGRVLVVEPRRIACRTLAGWVARQLGSEVGQEVGYCVRFDSRSSSRTRIHFVTPGVALGYAGSGELAGFDTVVVDEFHERGLETDLFVPLVKKLCPRTHLVVMSATLDGASLSSRLSARWLKAEGRRFEVEVDYLGGAEIPSGRGLPERVTGAIQRALAETDGNVLVFLPGMKAISEVANRVRNAPVVRLHGSFSHAEQDRAFQEGERRVILSTNVAESSVTVPGVTAVVDSGLVKQHIHRGGYSTLATVPVSQASAEQRRGRAGRVAPGRCYRLWSAEGELPATTPPELCRVELTELLLWIAAVGLTVEQLDFVDHPPAFALERARHRLQGWGAFDDQGRLSPRGKAMSALPLPAELAHLLVEAPPELLPDLCDLCAVIESRSGFFLFSNNEDVLEARRTQLAGPPPIASMLALRHGKVKEHHLHPDALAQARQVAQQLRALTQAPQGEEQPRRELARFLVERLPERAYVKRKQREAWGNGSNEVRLGREATLPEGVQAALMLEIEPIAGRGLGTELRGRNPLPCTFTMLLEAGLGEREVVAPGLRDGEVVADLKVTYAGRTLGRLEQTLTGPSLRAALAELILTDQLLAPAGSELRQALFYHNLAQALEGGSEVVEARPWLLSRLEELGVQEQADWSLLGPEDLAFPGVDSWQLEELARKYPASFSSGSARFEVEYRPARRLVILHWQSGLRNAPLSPAMLPRWNDWKVKLDERGRVTDVR